MADPVPNETAKVCVVCNFLLSVRARWHSAIAGSPGGLSSPARRKKRPACKRESLLNTSPEGAG